LILSSPSQRCLWRPSRLVDAILAQTPEFFERLVLDVLFQGRPNRKCRLKGVVKNITDYGAFIDRGGIDGLLRITDMSWGRVGCVRRGRLRTSVMLTPRRLTPRRL
jgi:S1 RNA binding family protein